MDGPAMTSVKLPILSPVIRFVRYVMRLPRRLQRWTMERMMAGMTQVEKPTKAQLGRIAENKPELLNILVAYFVMEWKSVSLTSIPHGQDQTGKVRAPNYVELWGVDACIHYLLLAPKSRGSKGPGYISMWLEEITK